MAKNQPLATYTERMLQVSRTFSLYRDQVTVHARWRSGRQYDMTIPLAGLKPAPRRFYVRYRLYRYAGWVMAVGMLITALGVYRQKPPPLSTLTAVGIAVGLVGLLFMAITYANRRILFARFEDAQGKAALDIARAGPDKARFEEFVEKIRKGINAAR